MNRPITSPSWAVLTSSATITLIPSARSCASSAPEISLWSVTAIAPRPRLLAVSSRTSTGVAQSGEWSVCMCRSQKMKPAPASRRAIAAWRPAAGGGGRRPARRSPPRWSATASQPSAVAPARQRRAKRRAAARSSISAGQLRREHVHVARLEQQAELAVAKRLFIDRDPAATGTAPAATPSAAADAAGAMPPRRRKESARASSRPATARSAPMNRTRSRRARAEPRRQLLRPRHPDHRPPARARRKPSQRTQEQRAGRHAPPRATNAISTSPPARRRLKRSRSTPGRTTS